MKTACDMENMQRTDTCPVFQLFDLLGKKRVINIIFLMKSGMDSFNQINKTMPHMSGKILSNRLKMLQQEGLITKDIESTTPLRIRYHLTDLGNQVAAHIEKLSMLMTQT